MKKIKCKQLFLKKDVHRPEKIMSLSVRYLLCIWQATNMVKDGKLFQITLDKNYILLYPYGVQDVNKQLLRQFL